MRLCGSPCANLDPFPSFLLLLFLSVRLTSLICLYPFCGLQSSVDLLSFLLFCRCCLDFSFWCLDVLHHLFLVICPVFPASLRLRSLCMLVVRLFLARALPFFSGLSVFLFYIFSAFGCHLFPSHETGAVLLPLAVLARVASVRNRAPSFFLFFWGVGPL